MSRCNQQVAQQRGFLPAEVVIDRLDDVCLRVIEVKRDAVLTDLCWVSVHSDLQETPGEKRSYLSGVNAPLLRGGGAARSGRRPLGVLFADFTGETMKPAYLVVLLLAGCVSAEEQAARQYLEAHAMKEAYRERVFNSCRAYGFREGTPEFSQCLMQVDQATQQRNSATGNAILQQMLRNQPIPACSSLPVGVAGYRKAEGTCR